MSILSEMKHANELANKHRAVVAKISKWFEDRYGCSYQDCDADDLIDALDYGTGIYPTTIQQIDKSMASGGKFPLSESKGEKS